MSYNTADIHMVANHTAVDVMVRILLKYLDRKTAVKMMREMHEKVPGNKSVMDTFVRVTEKLMEHKP